MTRQEIGAILQELREKAHKTREEVGDLLGKSAKTVGHWETGYASPDANTLFLLCTIYGADLNEAFGFKPSRPKTSKAALQLARDYDALDSWGRKALRALADTEMARCEDETRLQAEAAPEPDPEPSTNGRTVYITETGSKYHYDGNCGNGTYYPTTLDKAQSMGLTPCAKCAGG